MNRERLLKVLLGPVITEKAAVAGEAGNQIVFKVVNDADKREIKAAVETLFDVKVEDVRTLVTKGKTKRTRYGIGKRSDVKKAYVRLAEGQEIDFTAAE